MAFPKEAWTPEDRAGLDEEIGQLERAYERALYAQPLNRDHREQLVRLRAACVKGLARLRGLRETIA
jgi:hypothetical protein